MFKCKFYLILAMFFVGPLFGVALAEEPVDDGVKQTESAKKDIFGDDADDKGSIFGDKDDDPNYLGRLLYSILLIVVLGSIAMYLSKKFGPRLKSLSGQNMKIKESLHLGTGRSIHLLEVSGKTFLIGSTAGNINLLGDVSGSFAEHMEKFSKESGDAI